MPLKKTLRSRDYKGCAWSKPDCFVFFTPRGAPPLRHGRAKKNEPRTKKTEKIKCAKKTSRRTEGRRTDATIIFAWTQLIVTLCYNNLVSNTPKWGGVMLIVFFSITVFYL